MLKGMFDTVVRKRGQRSPLPVRDTSSYANDGKVHVLSRKWWRFTRNKLRKYTIGVCVFLTLISCLISSGIGPVARQQWKAKTRPRSGSRVRPRLFLMGDSSMTKSRTYDPNEWKIPKTLQSITKEKFDPKEEKRYERDRADMDDEDTGCPFIAPWQSTSTAPPNCNLLHEIGLHVGDKSAVHNIEYVASGAYRVVWAVLDEQANKLGFVLKTPFEDDKFRARDLYKNVRDGLVMEKSSSSPYVLDQYAFCASSSLAERAYSNLKQWLRARYRLRRSQEEDAKSSLKLLEIAVALAQGVADFHHVDQATGLATVAHADIKPSQFLVTNDDRDNPRIKVNDFNRCSFLTSKDGKSVCPFYMNTHHKGSTYRSPEEYGYKKGAQTDKIDVFSLGSVLFTLLTGEDPYDEVDDYELAQKYIMTGIEPQMSAKITNSTDPSLQAILTAMHMCRKVEASDRPISTKVAAFLTQTLQQQIKAR